jgi:hypothetical protein
MRQVRRRPNKKWEEGGKERLFAAKDKASDVVGLARGADELSHLLHEILHSCLGG